MRYAVCVPNLGAGGDPRVLVDLAVRAEAAGWDGYFCWDHIVVDPTWRVEIADPWIALAAIALATTRIRIGPMVAAIPRRRPWKLARESASLDLLSGGRLILGAGLGWPSGPEFGTFGEEQDPARRATMTDEALRILDGLWGGEPFSFTGEHYRLDSVTFRPRPLQRPRIPVWVAALRPGPEGPLHRAASWDGFAPAVADGPLPLGTFARDAARVLELRSLKGLPTVGYDMVVPGSTPGHDLAAASDTVAGFEAAGATWWSEVVSDWLGGLDAMRERIEAGPPRP